jgi:3-methyl-2-oxobutanoate hydroxymethyltransferase
MRGVFLPNASKKYWDKTMTKRLTIRNIQKMKDERQKIVMLTAYDAFSARVSEAAGVPMLLVGDSLGMVVQGHHSTIPVTMEQMIYHSEIVSRVTERPLVVGDLPFLSYNISPEQALENSGRLMQEAGVSCVKLEGGQHVAPTIKRIVQSGIPVMAHIGLTPQSVHQFGGFRVQGRQVEEARCLLKDAEAVQEAGAFAVVLELVPAELSKLVSERLRIPTIGIGAGPGCDGQVQVFHDLLAMFTTFLPKHAKEYATLGDLAQNAIKQYVEEVGAGQFPTTENSSSMSEEVLKALVEEM